MKAALLALSISLWAPYQCGTEPDERPQEDSAPKALWNLSEKFEQEGNTAARETTLRQIVEQYPSSRYSEKAREVMGMPSGRTSKFKDKDVDEKSEEQSEKKAEEKADPESGED